MLKAEYGDLPPAQPVTKLHDNGRTDLSWAALSGELTSRGSIRMYDRERHKPEVDTP